MRLNERIDLSQIDASEHRQFKGNKKAGLAKAEALLGELDRLQELLYAEHKHKILIVLQGMDTAGKDSTIRHVFRGVNPQGVRVASFKVPTVEELAHDFLWRVHKQTPGAGEIVIFNRSHYEDVLIVSVHGLISQKECRRRYTDINAFEQMLTNADTTILKFFLHIDRAEQKQRLQARLADETKQWKFNADDLKERVLWQNYQRAYAQALSATSTRYAPWYIIPANHKWYRDLIISQILVEHLHVLKMSYPKPPIDVDKIVIDD